MKSKMKKKGRRNKKPTGPPPRRRNAAPTSAPRRRQGADSVLNNAPTLGEALWSAGAAVVGSLASGIAVNQRIAKEESAALAMIAAGGIGVLATQGNARIGMNSLASAGIGQYTLALMARRATPTKPPTEAAPQLPATNAPQLPAPAVPGAAPPRQSDDGGYVLDMFRDASDNLAALDEDAWRFGARDADAGYDAMDYDEAA